MTLAQIAERLERIEREYELVDDPIIEAVLEQIERLRLDLEMEIARVKIA